MGTLDRAGLAETLETRVELNECRLQLRERLHCTSAAQREEVRRVTIHGTLIGIGGLALSKLFGSVVSASEGLVARQGKKVDATRSVN